MHIHQLRPAPFPSGTTPALACMWSEAVAVTRSCWGSLVPPRIAQDQRQNLDLLFNHQSPLKCGSGSLALDVSHPVGESGQESDVKSYTSKAGRRHGEAGPALHTKESFPMSLCNPPPCCTLCPACVSLFICGFSQSRVLLVY